MSSDSPLAVARALPDPLLLVTLEGEIRDANASAELVLGRSREMLLTQSLFEITNSSRETIEDYLRSCSRTNRLIPGSFEVRTEHGQPASFRCGGCGVRLESGHFVLIQWTPITVTRSGFVHLNQQIESLRSEIKNRKATEASLRDSEARTRTILETAAESILTFLDDGTVESFNLAAEHTFGYRADEIVGRNLRMLLPPRIAEVDQATLLDYLGYQHLQRSQQGRNLAHEVHARHRDGSLFPAEFSLAELSLEGRHLFVGILRDIRERKQLQDRLIHQANHDPLTGLPNRVLLEDRLAQAIESARRRDEMVALFFIDLDRFKVINDSLGHELGDDVLRDFAARLQHECRGCDTVARLGGDEFVWLVTGIHSEQDVFAPASRVLARAAEPFELKGRQLVVSASVGISLFPRDGGDAAGLLGCADAAMYVAKAAGRNTYEAYSSEIRETASRRLEMESRLRDAIQNGELCLHYQPQVSLSDGVIRGVEALVRWEDPDIGLVGPDAFIPLAEETGLIVPLGAWVLEEACRQAVRWREEGLSELRMAVNVSPRQFEQFDLLEFLEKTLDKTNLDPRRLELELTEGCVMANVEKNKARLAALKELGVGISIDDFGTGHSSLGYLQRFPIDVIKIDRCFVKDMERNEGDLTLVRTIIGLTHNLGLRVVAEGVETEEQLALLQLEGCDEAQGYLVSRPLPAAEIAPLLFAAAADVS